MIELFSSFLYSSLRISVKKVTKKRLALKVEDKMKRKVMLQIEPTSGPSRETSIAKGTKGYFKGA